ncbi:hypothetical protein RclHR1_03840016 [Rhizophagus clarus]|uniref:Reverse transcriptase domain-containing protein n=1 Tax=Rhizophagus clarus TaxID=94130 RepID=A0A2Z6RE52_9GLOM|nr:hypothetical protein RclHR1_03840016 [Rhizophagus clarus]
MIGDSTFTSIRLINNVIEDAKEHSKELWIVLQDIFKAFDSISLDFLSLALKCIGLPIHAVQCIINLFKGRQIQVATAFGPSPVFQDKDGIDQGDSFSPLLWRIYYDPLLATVTLLPNKGYTMDCIWSINPQELDTWEHFSHRIAISAYMDDTAWSDMFKNRIQDTLDIARSFYELVDIKSTTKSTRSLTKQQLLYVQNKFLATIKHKRRSIGQVVYLINKVLYSKLIYLSQLSTFTKPEWDAIE